MLFDLWLDGLADSFRCKCAEKIAVSLAVLIFFWGMFASRLCRHATPALVFVPVHRDVCLWLLLPHGIHEFLHFAGPGVFWHRDFLARQRLGPLVPVALAPLIMLAHPLGFAWLVAGSAYVAMAEADSATLSDFAAGSRGPSSLLCRPLLFLAPRYRAGAGWSPLLFQRSGPISSCSARDMRFRNSRFSYLSSCALGARFLQPALGRLSDGRTTQCPLQLYVIVCLAVILLPDGIRFPHQPSSLALLTERLTSVSAALLCCLLGAVQPRKWHLSRC